MHGFFIFLDAGSVGAARVRKKITSSVFYSGVNIVEKRGRKSAYDTQIKPRFSEISEWLKSGATEKQIAFNLGISYSTLNKYKAEKTEFAEFLKNGRETLVKELRGALVKKALGFEYYEETEVKELDRDLNILVVTRKERKKKYAQPDVAALNLCLKNYDADNWAIDPQALKLKEKELELRREIADRDAW